MFQNRLLMSFSVVIFLYCKLKNTAVSAENELCMIYYPSNASSELTADFLSIVQYFLSGQHHKYKIGCATSQYIFGLLPEVRPFF
jgi:hypothetical protein